MRRRFLVAIRQELQSATDGVGVFLQIFRSRAFFCQLVRMFTEFLHPPADSLSSIR